jgi:hypothetical protein
VVTVIVLLVLLAALIFLELAVMLYAQASNHAEVIGRLTVLEARLGLTTATQPEEPSTP